jgi:hypothetical protein
MADKTTVPMKTCTKCGETKPKTDYYNGGQCKECRKADQRERHKLAKEKREKMLADPDSEIQTKTCTVCSKEKNISEFRSNRGDCHDCEKAFGRKYNKEHKDIRDKWQEENREYFDLIRAYWYQMNKPSVRARYNHRYHTDSAFKIHRLTHSRIRYCVKKIKSTRDYIGTEFEQVAKWLEYNFTEDMSWKNHGEIWDIDHVIPVCRWDLEKTEDITMCFNWKNLSPLASAVNRHQKREKIDKNQVVEHLEKLKLFCHENKIDDELQKYKQKCKQLIN